MRSIKALALLAIAASIAAGSSIEQSAYRVIQDEGTPQTRGTTINFTGAGITCGPTAAGVTPCDVPATPAAQQHTITAILDNGGTAIPTGDVKFFPTAAFACTINRIDVSADVSGSITVDVWKAAGAIPTAANKISASAPASLTAAQLHQSGSLTGWTTSVSSGDVFGFTVATVATVTRVTIQIWCQ